MLPEMTTVEHLTELRRRLLICLAAFVAGSVFGWMAAPHLLRRFMADIGRTFVFVSPGEAFASHLKLALLVGLALALPVIVVQGWLFVLPARSEERRVGKEVELGVGLWHVGRSLR